MALKTIEDFDNLVTQVSDITSCGHFSAEQAVIHVFQVTDHPLVNETWKKSFANWISSLGFESYIKQYPHEELQIKLNAPNIWKAWNAHKNAVAALAAVTKDYLDDQE